MITFNASPVKADRQMISANRNLDACPLMFGVIGCFALYLPAKALMPKVFRAFMLYSRGSSVNRMGAFRSLHTFVLNNLDIHLGQVQHVYLEILFNLVVFSPFINSENIKSQL